MMQSIVSISPKGTPPPPTRNPHHRHHHDMLAMRHDINPATYYAESRSGLMTPPGARLPRASRTRHKNHASSSCMNLLSHSDQNESTAADCGASSSLMDLWSYTTDNNHTSNTMTQQSYFNFMDIDDFNLRANDEFNHHNEFALSPNASYSNLYDSLKAKNASNKKRYKQNKVRSNIANYMRYMTMDGSQSSDEEGFDRHEYEYDLQANFEPQHALGPQTNFDSVNDIFCLIPNASNDASSEQKQKQQQVKQIRNLCIDTAEDGNICTKADSVAKQHRCFIDKVREIFDEHDLSSPAVDDDSADNEAVFASIHDICQDLVEKRHKMQQYEHEYKHLERFMSRLKRENMKLKRQNNELEQRLNLSDITKDNILLQMCQYMSELLDELPSIAGKYGANGSAANVYKHIKAKLKGCHESLVDLALDLDEDELRSAVEKLKKGIDDIEFLEHHGVYKQNHLENIMKGLVEEFGDKSRIKRDDKTPNGSKQEKEIECDQSKTFEEEDEKEIEAVCDNNGINGLTKYGVFEEECPRVVRIDIDGGWFNKKTRAIIKYRGEVFGRKEADFKWLYKMLQCDFKWLSNEAYDDTKTEDAQDEIIPAFNKELPHNMWNANYLMKRKRELNLFLMQCHSLRNIKSGTPYHIFLQRNKEQWKHKRNEFDKIMLDRIKRNDH